MYGNKLYLLVCTGRRFFLSSAVIIPTLFILLYSSGFVGAKLGLPHAEPMTFLSLRFLIAAAALAIIATVVKAPWPESFSQIKHQMITGIFLQAVFSIGVFCSLAIGLPPAISGLIIALQPLIITMLMTTQASTRPDSKLIFASLLGLAGVALTLAPGLALSNGFSTTAVSLSVLGLMGLVAGNLLQKKHANECHVLTAGVVQTLTAAVLSFVIAAFTETMTIDWTLNFTLALFWMAILVSTGALSLFALMLKNQSADKVAQLFYLIPVISGLLAWLMFDDQLTLLQSFGMAIVSASLYLAFSTPKRQTGKSTA